MQPGREIEHLRLYRAARNRSDFLQQRSVAVDEAPVAGSDARPEIAKIRAGTAGQIDEARRRVLASDPKELLREVRIPRATVGGLAQ